MAGAWHIRSHLGLGPHPPLWLRGCSDCVEQMQDLRTAAGSNSVLVVLCCRGPLMQLGTCTIQKLLKSDGEVYATMNDDSRTSLHTLGSKLICLELGKVIPPAKPARLQTAEENRAKVHAPLKHEWHKSPGTAVTVNILIPLPTLFPRYRSGAGFCQIACQV